MLEKAFKKEAYKRETAANTRIRSNGEPIFIIACIWNDGQRTTAHSTVVVHGTLPLKVGRRNQNLQMLWLRS
jgi:hypothetical protein